jgi:hypothetical protein
MRSLSIVCFGRTFGTAAPGQLLPYPNHVRSLSNARCFRNRIDAIDPMLPFAIRESRR